MSLRPFPRLPRFPSNVRYRDDIPSVGSRYYSRLEEEVELENGEVVKAWVYALENFKPDLLEGPHLSNYCSKELNELAYKFGSYENPEHEMQVKFIN